MDVYLDAAVFTKDRSLLEWCELLRRTIFIARIFHNRAKCPKICWMRGEVFDGKYSYEDFVREIKNPQGVFAKSVPERDYKQFRNDFFTAFRGDAKAISNVYAKASVSASLVWYVTNSNVSVVVNYSKIKPELEAVRVSGEINFQCDEVCRVLYCNHPEVLANSQRKGYSIALYLKHSQINQLGVEKDNEWIDKTKNGDASQFLPQWKYRTKGYECLVKGAIFSAMKSGKYSEQRMNSHVYESDVVVGASNGSLTTKVCLCIKDANVHIYPL